MGRQLLCAVPLLAVVSACQLAGRKPIREFTLRLEVPNRGAAFSNVLYQTVGVELQPGHEIKLLKDGPVFDEMVESIEAAKVSVDIVTFIWAAGKCSGRLMTSLAAANSRGVKCRVVLDAVGSLTFDDAPLRAAGCEVHRFRPVPGQDDLARNHRKLVIVDGKIGFIGGFGIDDKWLGHGQREEEWRDTNARVRGPAVLEMQQAFAENWLEAGGDLLPPREFPDPARAGPALAGLVTSTGTNVVTKGDRLMQLLIAAAHQRLWISNAYFVPSEPILELLAKKAREGVDVRVLSAGDKTDTRIYLPDQRERVGRLLPSGVRAFEYAPTMFHAKTVVVDDDLVAVGSLNLDALSLNKMDEATLVAQDKILAAELAQAFVDDMARSLEVKLPKAEAKP